MVMDSFALNFLPLNLPSIPGGISRMPSKLLRSAVIDTELYGPFLFNLSFTLHSSFDCTAILPEKSDSKLPK